MDTTVKKKPSKIHIFSYLLVCFIHVTAQYILESPAGLELSIIQVMKVTTAEYNLLFSFYAWPNLILCLVGGLIIDRILGLRAGYLGFIAIINSGQLLIMLGAFFNKFWLMLIGRLLVGSGGEMLKAIHRAFAALWLKDYIIIALSIQIMFGRLGGTLALAIGEPIYQSLYIIEPPLYRLGTVLSIGFGLTFICFILAIVVVILMRHEMSRKAERSLKSLFVDLKDFSLSFWLVFVIILTFLAIIFSFSIIGQVFFIDKFGLSVNQASFANAIIFGGVVVLVPFLGFTINKVGFILYWLIGCYCLLILAHLLYISCEYWMHFIPFIGSFSASLAYGMFGVTAFAIPSYLIQKHQLTTAYSLLQLANNIGISTFTVINGILIDTKGYLLVEIFLTSIVFTGLVATIFLLLVNPGINVSGYNKKN